MKFKLLLLSAILLFVLSVSGCAMQPGKSAFAGKATEFSESGSQFS